MAMVSFKKGVLANLPATKTAGTFYVTTDERAMYLDVDASTRIRLGDFQEFASVTALTANPNPSTTALYYVSDINCLAKWDGAQYVQINKDTGMTSIEVTGDGNAITAAVYDADGRKLTLTKGATYMTSADVDGKINTKVGELKIGDTTYDTVKAYVDQKTSGIATDASLSALTARVTTAEGEIDALQTAIAEGGAVTLAIADAKKAGTDAQAAAGQAKADAAAAQADVDALEGKVGTVADGKTVVSMIGDVETAYKAKDTELATSIKAISDDYLKSVDKTELQGNIDKKVDQTSYNAKVTALETADTTLQRNIDNEAKTRKDADDAQVARIATLESQITGLSGAMHFEGVKTEVPADVSGYEAGDVIIVGEKEYVFNGTAFVEFGDVSAEGERIAALETTVGKAAEGENPATGLIKDIADNAAAITAEEARAKAAETANATAASEAKAAADAAQSDVNAIAADYLKAADKTALEGSIGGVSDRVTAIENKSISNGANKVEKSDINGNIKIDGAETVVYTHPAEHAISEVTGLQSALDAKAAQTSLETTNANVAANASAISALESGKADKATTLAGYGITDAYTKTETYTQTEVNALLEWGSF